MSGRARRIGAGLSGMSVLGAVSLAYATLVEPRWYRLRHDTLPVLRDKARRPLRVLHLSDLHLLPGQAHKERFVESLSATGPDLVVVTGDIIGHPGAIDDAVELLGRVARGRLAVAVLGSNDYYLPTLRNPLRYFAGPSDRVSTGRMDTERLVTGMADRGWEWMDNRRCTLPTPAGPVDLVGLGDAHIGADHPEVVELDGAAPAEAALRLGVAHAPYVRVLDTFDTHGLDLALAGHTHGGQLRVPFVGALVDNCDLPLGMARGTSRYGVDLWLHVSAGLGASRYAPIRFACRPEASLLDLIPA